MFGVFKSLTATSKIKIFRVENEQNEGPYTCARCISVISSASCSVYRPLPTWDGIEYERDQDFFGFADETQLHSWFSEDERQKLRELGMKCNVYEVPKKYVIFGKKQVAFRLKEATKVGESDALQI